MKEARRQQLGLRQHCLQDFSPEPDDFKLIANSQPSSSNSLRKKPDTSGEMSKASEGLKTTALAGMPHLKKRLLDASQLAADSPLCELDFPTKIATDFVGSTVGDYI